MSIFVRDRGRGFDPEEVAEDRRGISGSIVDRLARAGGAGQVRIDAAAKGPRSRCRCRARRRPQPHEPTRVFLVDDHQLFLSGVRAELGDRVEVVGSASDVDAAIEMIRDRTPDVVLVDVHMPSGGGARVIAEVLATHPDTRFLALSVSDAPEDVIATIRAGARGYVTKTIAPDDLVDAIGAVAAGDAVFSPRLAGFVLDAFSSEAPPATDPELEQLDAARAGSAAADRARLRVQRGRARSRHLGEDGRDPRVVGAAQAPTLEPPPARPLGHRPPSALISALRVATVMGRRGWSVRGGGDRRVGPLVGGLCR